MKQAYLLTGPNCSGKTTAVQRTLGNFDGEVRIISIRADNDGRFKGKAPEQEAALTEVWFSPTPVVIFEGTRINTPLMRVARAHPGERQLTVLMTTQQPDVMRRHMRDRCAKRNKTFRADYWTHWKLVYEGQKRYPNNFRKNGITPIIFDVDEEYRVVDEIVGTLTQKIREALEGVPA